MKKLQSKSDFRIVVYPRRLGDLGMVRVSDDFISSNVEKEYIGRCEDMIADMKRHVDNFGSASVECDKHFVCSECGSPWTEAGSEYNGGCCDADEANNPAES